MPALLAPRPAPTLPPEEFLLAVWFGLVPCWNRLCDDGMEIVYAFGDDWPGEPEPCRICSGTGFVAGDRR